ncbi:uncharacterized protein LOC122088893 [Macadamia integrifolia]|uniref:uncharacterized protein LOC122088893 n=1 Tax=Macadamia integrifolia TaxID=60698 RepID=UPI001C4F07A9|nr:uncharacterized protein LOC122088893 [Macadamia integrifolia]
MEKNGEKEAMQKCVPVSSGPEFQRGTMASDLELRTSTGKQALISKDLEQCSSPTKKPKIVTLTPPISASKGKGKGKGKVDDEINSEGEGAPMDSDQKICGICLSDDGKAIRGWIDSCDHYFCFVCIMEWSKVESRCPMCKQRFSNIRRPPKDGVFIRERMVNIPVRDQVYHPFGNATTGPSDPYAEVRCSECNGKEDESMLLLCDLCDTAAHTYCVGLGTTVPEGDWYCHDCAISRDEHSNSEVETDCGDRKFSMNFDVTPNKARVSIFDIVRESNIPEVDRTSERISADPNQLSQRDSRAGSKVREPGARTLHRCRNVHSRIRVLRENWNALRRGSLDFSSSLRDSCGKSSVKESGGAVCHKRSSHLQFSSSMSCQQMPSQDTVSGDMVCDKNPYDIDRAWKMLDIAKSVQRACQGSSVNHLASSCPSANGRTSKETANVNSSSLVPRNKYFESKDLRSAWLKNNKAHSLDMAQENHRPQKFAKRSPSRDVMEETSKFDTGYPTTHLSVHCRLPSARQLQPLKVDVYQKSKGHKSLKVSHGASSNSNLNNVRDGSASSMILVDSFPGCFDTSHRKAEICASSGCKVEPTKANGELEKNSSPAESTGREDADAKSEVQSLVKLNLKLLTRDKRLGVDGFKEVARQATHTILAACGLNHTKSLAHSFPNPMCSHASQSRKIHMSKLMSSSCRECFYVFVKDVVNSIMAEKIAGLGTC